MSYSDGYCRYRGVVHGLDTEGCHTLCGADAHALVLSSEVRADVTCKRCLASLAKRDREFRRKARKGFRRVLHAFAMRGEAFRVSGYYTRDTAATAARAIAAEESRS